MEIRYQMHENRKLPTFEFIITNNFIIAQCDDDAQRIFVALSAIMSSSGRFFRISMLQVDLISKLKTNCYSSPRWGGLAQEKVGGMGKINFIEHKHIGKNRFLQTNDFPSAIFTYDIFNIDI